MQCSKCSKSMRLLFVSWVCDYCDGLANAGEPKDTFDYRGFIVLRNDGLLPCQEYVFATLADAERWQTLGGIGKEASRIEEVRADKPFRWQPSRGTVRGIILADALYKVYESAAEYRKENQREACYINYTKAE